MGGIVIKRMVAYLRPHKALLVGAFLGALLSVPLGLLVPVFVGQAIDQIVAPGQVHFPAILRILFWLAASAVAAGILQWMLLVCTRKLSALAAQELRRGAFESINNAPLKVLDAHSRGDIVSRLVNDADLVAEGLLQALSQLLPGAITIVATIVVMFTLSIPIALVVIVATPLSILFARFIAQRTAKMFRDQSKAQGKISGHVNETVNGHQVVRAFGYEGYSAAEFAALNEEYFTANFKATFYSSISNPGTRLVNAFVYAAVGMLGALTAIGGGITVGGLSAFLSYANQYTRPFNEVSAVLTQMQSAVAGAERLFEIIDWPTELADEPDAAAPQNSEGQVWAQDVAFAYRKDKPLIRDFSFRAKPGQRIALVGATGCGKTTIINLLMRFYELDGGSIRIDGEDTTHIRRNALRGLFGMVLQDTWLKAVSVQDNIAYGFPNATLDEVILAAKEAKAHSFIRRLPEGYNTIVEPGGGNLSAGQRQLLCIARIMLAKPDMLILDEATSSIDTRTEMLIQRALEKLMRGHTSFVVAHRLSTIQNADCILVMDAGRIVERGTHDELLRLDGFYAGIYNSQFRIEE